MSLYIVNIQTTFIYIHVFVCNRISCELYSMICQSDEAVIHVFKSNGVTIDYVSPTHTVIVCGPSNQVHSVEQHFEKYCEKELQCSPLQWMTLVENGKRLLNELIGPFQHNPAVNIIEKSSLLLVVGLTDAVKGAHQYLFKSLNKSIKAERLLHVMYITLHRSKKVSF